MVFTMYPWSVNCGLWPCCNSDDGEACLLVHEAGGAIPRARHRKRDVEDSACGTDGEKCNDRWCPRSSGAVGGSSHLNPEIVFPPLHAKAHAKGRVPGEAAHWTKAYLDFGVHLGLAYLSARRTFGRPNRPAESTL